MAPATSGVTRDNQARTNRSMQLNPIRPQAKQACSEREQSHDRLTANRLLAAASRMENSEGTLVSSQELLPQSDL